MQCSEPWFLSRRSSFACRAARLARIIEPPVVFSTAFFMLTRWEAPWGRGAASWTSCRSRARGAATPSASNTKASTGARRRPARCACGTIFYTTMTLLPALTFVAIQLNNRGFKMRVDDVAGNIPTPVSKSLFILEFGWASTPFIWLSGSSSRHVQEAAAGRALVGSKHHPAHCSLSGTR